MILSVGYVGRELTGKASRTGRSFSIRIVLVKREDGIGIRLLKN